MGNNLFYSNIWDGKERVNGNFIIDEIINASSV